jgi:hypothetical protein
MNNNIEEDSSERNEVVGKFDQAFYSPSGTYENYDSKTGRFFNQFGQQLRDPKEYDSHSEGYTPFGDE